MTTGQGFIGNNMFAYCLNNPIAYSDNTGSAAKICFSAASRIEESPWRDLSPSGGGRMPANYTSPHSYGSVSDKFYTIMFLKFIFNTDEQAVLDAKYLAFYKGTPVIKIPLMKNNAFSIGIIFMGNTVSDEATVRHEYGHTLHLLIVGLPSYTFNALIPSLVDFWSNVPYGEYYSEPQEYIADVLGGVERVYGTQPYAYSISPIEAIAYFIATMLY